MNPSRWDRIEQIFHDAVDRRDEDRRRFIAESCAGDEELQSEVESLLRESEGATEFMGGPHAGESATGVFPDVPPEALAPRFTILRKIGSGGMGVVYLARDRETDAVLAVKVLHPETAGRAGLAQRSRANPRPRWRMILAIVASVMMARLTWLALELFGVPTALILIASINSAAAVAMLMPYIFIALERAAPKIGPHKLSTFIRVFSRKVTSEPCGLAIFRGTLVGLALMAVDILLVWFAMNHLGMWMDSTALNFIHFYRNLWWAAGQNALLSVGVIPYFAAYIAWLAAMAAAFVQRSWLVILLAAALMAVVFPSFPIVSTLGFIQPYPWKAPLVLLEYLILVWTFSRFDFLTMTVAMCTFVFCSRNYFFFVMLSPTGAADEKIGFAVWGLFVAAAAVMAFKSSITSTYRRAMASFQ